MDQQTCFGLDNLCFFIKRRYEEDTSVGQNISMAAFTGDGLSIIASKLGSHMLIDSYRTTMCEESLGRNSYTRALIELNAENVMKDQFVAAIPLLDKPSYIRTYIPVEHEWTPPSATLVDTTTQPSSSLFNVEEDSEGEMEHVYDVNGTFMAGGSRYETKSLYERRKESKEDDPCDTYDDDVEYNDHDLSKNQLVVCDACDINCSRSEEVVCYVLSHLSQM
nr:hypothetical protein [Tanacetum cinerariifolium]